MPINITMPALSPTMEEGNLAKWLVKEGDKVAPGDVIAEIETDKATMEVEAVDEGTVAKIVVPAGTEGVKVNALIAVLAAEGEDAAAAAKGGGGNGADVKAEAPAKGEAKQEEPPTSPLRGGRAEGAGGGAENSSTPTPAPRADPPLKREGNGSGRTFASPLARRIARDAGIDVSAVTGSGPHGRVVKADVEAAIAGGGAKAAPAAKAAPGAAPAAAPAAKPMSDEAVLKLFAEGTYELVPHDNMRKTIARRLVEAKSTIPHFYLTLDCELDALLALRSQLNAAAPVKKTDKGEVPAYKLSVNDLIIKALALALRDVPTANVSWTETAMVQHRHADVGVAVSIPGGLITPIVRHADEKTLSVISNEMKDMAARARNKKLKPEEYQGGTTAVSNLGMFGIKDFAAVINPPHATILAVGAGEERAVVKNGEVKIATMMSVTLSTDHRAVDGALGAELLGAFKRHIENPMGMLV
jgi:pyruvate dehydrogenase E2 component (dihydrolipoamide acetyltransferase)